ncbi:MAG: hypothetical protein ACOH5I_20425 [Oligoflexus sp.]
MTELFTPKCRSLRREERNQFYWEDVEPMAKRWNVYQGEQVLGLMTAQEIRRALRDGSLDPFDLVALEGSENKVELVEVDEIFQEHTKPDLQAAEAEAQVTQVASPKKVAEKKPSNRVPKAPKPSFPEESTNTGTRSRASFPGEATLNDPVPSDGGKGNATHLPKRIRTNTVSDKKKDKKFYLIDDKNRVLGPLTAVEVQSLFYRGILNKQVKVQKTGSDRRIPVRQFISAYSGKRMKALADQGGSKALKGAPGHPSSKVLNELYHLINSKKLAETRGKFGPSLGLVFLGVGLGLAIYLIFDWKKVQDTELQKKRPPRPALIQRESEPSASTPERNSNNSSGSSSSEQALPRPSAAKSPPRNIPRPAPRRTSRPAPRQESVSTPPARPARVETRPAPIEMPPPSPRQQPAQTRSPAPAKRESGPIAQAMATAGSVISVGPIQFSQSELQNCALKCELTFRDAQGGQLTAVFFKGAYFDQLAAKEKGVVILTGSSKLEDGKLILFIQDIR